MAALPNTPFISKPDVTVYDILGPDERRDVSNLTDLDSSLAEFFIEFKGSLDPFCKDMKLSSQKSSLPFANIEGVHGTVLGQITSYATLILGSQHRTHTFLVLILKEYARLIRWDRSGAIVTEPIHFDQPFFYSFFIRYNNASCKVRGHDTTIHLPYDHEDKAACAVIQELALHCTSDGSPRPRLLTVTKPCLLVIPAELGYQYDIPAGRWTRTFVAYDVDRKKCVFLKDSWWLHFNGVPSEGNVYRKLQKHNVPNIPCFHFAGDVDIKDHRTETCQSAEALGFGTFKSYLHYRLVLHTIGRPLKKFSSSFELVNAVYSALLGRSTSPQHIGSVA